MTPSFPQAQTTSRLLLDLSQVRVFPDMILPNGYLFVGSLLITIALTQCALKHTSKYFDKLLQTGCFYVLSFGTFTPGTRTPCCEHAQPLLSEPGQAGADGQYPPPALSGSDFGSGSFSQHPMTPHGTEQAAHSMFSQIINF